MNDLEPGDGKILPGQTINQRPIYEVIIGYDPYEEFPTEEFDHRPVHEAEGFYNQVFRLAKEYYNPKNLLKDMTIIYHDADLDGICSGAILIKRFPYAKLIGHDYGRELPLIPDGQDIIMADISLPMDQMGELARRSNSFVFIDHHETAIRQFKAMGLSLDITGVLDTKFAACELTWDHCYPGVPAPRAVRLLGMYDTWRNQTSEQWETEILPFQYGMRWVQNPDDFPKEVLYSNLADYCDEYIRDGKTILRYQRVQDKKTCKYAFETVAFGHNTIAMNATTFNSQSFESVYDPAKHDLMMVFCFNQGRWKFSIYSTRSDIHCGELAALYGGGGHKGAAGFQVDRIEEVCRL